MSCELVFGDGIANRFAANAKARAYRFAGIFNGMCRVTDKQTRAVCVVEFFFRE
jgi:hypothetical protein